MELSSIPNICLHLIWCAFQRCRVSEELCRLSVVLKSSSPPSSTASRISISDTGIGSSLEEFQDIRLPTQGNGVESWDGLLSVKTTSILDNEVYNYHINLSESISSRRLTRLPSNPKNGLRFSGSDVCLVFSVGTDALVAEINHFFQKILILKIPNVAMELVVEYDDTLGSQCKMVFLANEINPLPFSAPNIERLNSGFGNYVLKHRNSLQQKCDSCFSTLEHLKVGSGTVCSKGSQKSSSLMVEVIVVISESVSTCPFAVNGSKTEVLYFKNFKPCPIPQSSLNALRSIDWKTYGLTLNVEDCDGVLEWENLPSHVHIDMALHCYHDQIMFLPSTRRKSTPDQNLIKRAAKAAMNNLKEKYAGSFLSVHTLKTRSYAPELARSIAGLILSSTDPDFKRECFSLLGLKSREFGGEVVEDCIKEKIISVIEMNDRKSHRIKEGAPFLFEDDSPKDQYLSEQEYEEVETEGEDAFSYTAEN